MYRCVCVISMRYKFSNTRSRTLETLRYHTIRCFDRILKVETRSWVYWQIRKIASFTCARNAGNVSPSPWVSDPDMHHASASGTCRDTCRDRLLAVSFGVGCGETFRALPAHAQPAISRIWQEAHWPRWAMDKTLSYCKQHFQMVYLKEMSLWCKSQSIFIPIYPNLFR